MTDTNSLSAQNIDNMTAGQEMDTFVAGILEKPIFPYSTDIKHAWDVTRWCVDYADGDLFIEHWQDGEWFICNTNLLSRKNDTNDDTVITARSDKNWEDMPSFPLAICRYCLKCAIKMKIVELYVIRR